MTILFALLLAQAAGHPCMADAQKLCPGVKPGDGRIAACLKEHKAQISAECNSRIAEFREEAQACEADVQKLCPNTKPGPERRDCMRAHKDQVSPECKQLFEHVMERRGDMHEAMRACGGDVAKFCKGAQPGGGRIMECLKAHQSELTPDCAAKLQ
jgi:hypothetical protein